MPFAGLTLREGALGYHQCGLIKLAGSEVWSAGITLEMTTTVLRVGGGANSRQFQLQLRYQSLHNHSTLSTPWASISV